MTFLNVGICFFFLPYSYSIPLLVGPKFEYLNAVFMRTPMSHDVLYFTVRYSLHVRTDQT
jgi:hypothetical protein